MTSPNNPTGQANASAIHEAAYEAALAAYLAEFPAMTWRDFPGSGLAQFDPSLVAPDARPWHLLDQSQVRYLATSHPARFLAKEVRQAAARDPKLAFDEATRRYVRFDAAAGRAAGQQGAVSASPSTD